jgi:hypothetical protein
VDAVDYLWVEEYAEPGVDPTIWTVFDPEGRIQGFFQTPCGREVLEIGADYLLTRRTDELDVEFVEKWHLDRRGS